MSGLVAAVLLLAMGVGCLITGWVRSFDDATSATGFRRFTRGRSLLLVVGGLLIVLAALDGLWASQRVETVRLTVAHKTSAIAGDIRAYTIEDTGGRKYGTSGSVWNDLRVGDRVTCETSKPLLLGASLERCEPAAP